MARTKKTRTLQSKRAAEQERGCATVPVPREDVLDNGRVPKGCRFVEGGDVLCTPAMAERAGVIAVERKKEVPRRRRAKKKSSRKRKKVKKEQPPEDRQFCYSPRSPLPYKKRKNKDGERELRAGCVETLVWDEEEQENVTRICCERNMSRAKKKPKKSRTRNTSQQSLPGVNGMPLEAAFADLPLRDHHRPEPAGFALLDDSLRPNAELSLLEGLGQTEEGDELTLLDESTSVAPGEAPLSRDPLLPSSEVVVPEPEPEHLSEFGDFLLMHLGGAALVAGGLALTYEIVDEVDYFEDKPVARASAFVGMGAVPAMSAWYLSQGNKYGDEIRTLAAAWGITFTAVGLLGLIRSLLEKQASETDDAEDRKNLEQAADHFPFYWPDEPPPPSGEGGGAGDPGGSGGSGGSGGAGGGSGSGGSGGDDEIVTDTDEEDPGTEGVRRYSYPMSRFR